MTELSVVIPTHNRLHLLRRHLQLLRDQSLAPARFQVIVVADGCTDNTAEVIRNLDLPYRVTVVEQNPGTGAAGARNRGAREARSNVLLFLDDDMEPRPDLLCAHLKAHRETPGAVVLGYYPMQAAEPNETPFTKFARLWWAERLDARSHPDYRFSFYDLCTGNVSLPRSLFEQAGGFDETICHLGAGEDYELGYRLIRQRVPFVFARHAETVHHSEVSFDTVLRRMKEDGYGQAVMARKHPELFWEFNVSRLSRLSERPLLRPIWVAVWNIPVLTEAPMAMVRSFAKLALALNLESVWMRLHRILKAHQYWKGVRRGLGTLSNWERLAQDAPYEPPDCREVDFDVSYDLQDLEAFVSDHGPIDAVRVFASGQPVGRIAPWVAAESLKPRHIRAALAGQFGFLLLAELTCRTKSSQDFNRYEMSA